MKYLLFLVFSIMLSINAYSQGHLEFKGVPIEGDINSFVKKLESKGFEVNGYVDTNVLMNGLFTGLPVDLIVFGSKNTKTVWKVSVSIGNDELEWKDLKALYEEYKELYIKKYGDPYRIMVSTRIYVDSNRKVYH